MKAAFAIQLRPGLLPLLLAYVMGLVFYLLQDWLLEGVLGQVPHPLEWLAGAADPFTALALWTLSERLLSVLAAGTAVVFLLARLLQRPQWTDWLGAAAVAATLGWLQAGPGTPTVYPFWVQLIDWLLVAGAIPLLAWLLPRRRAHEPA